jgi:hypothetical protein
MVTIPVPGAEQLKIGFLLLLVMIVAPLLIRIIHMTITKHIIDSITEVTSQTGEFEWVHDIKDKPIAKDDQEDVDTDNNNEPLTESMKPITNVLLFNNKFCLVYSGDSILFSLSNVDIIVGFTSSVVTVEIKNLEISFDSNGNQIAAYAVVHARL